VRDISIGIGACGSAAKPCAFGVYTATLPQETYNGQMLEVKPVKNTAAKLRTIVF
jgi:hypothetical protein